MKKFFKDLDYSFVVLILYIVKSVFFPNPIDLGIIALLSIVFILRYITNRFFDSKEKIHGDSINNEQFLFLEERSEKKFQDVVSKEIEEMRSEVSNLKQSISLKGGLGGRK